MKHLAVLLAAAFPFSKRKTTLCWVKAGILLSFSPLAAHAQVNFESSDLPIIILNTNGQDIPDEPKLDASMQVIDNGPGQINHLSDPPNHFNGRIGIELRGSTSNWLSDKKPYAVETRDAAGGDLKFPLLGMPEASDWAFLAPFNDKTLVREAFMFNLARRSMPWASRSRFVEVVLNGQYQGVYLVAEKIKRGKDRVDIANLKADDLAGDSLTGGYILKIDKTTGGQNEGWVSPYPPIPGGWQTTLWQIEYPKITEVQPAQKAYIEQWVTDFESAMSTASFADTAVGYPKHIDIQSFVDFTLLNELAKCVDAYRISTFLYKDKDSKDPRLHAGPVWDFNIALGNANYCSADNPTGWIIDFNQFCPGDNWVVGYWWTKMWEDPAYRRRLKERWTELRAGPLSDTEVYHLLDSLTATVQEAQVRNFQRWPVLDAWIWPNAFCCGAYPEHVAFLRNWIKLRLEWMDKETKTLDAGEAPREQNSQARIFPNPSDGIFRINCVAELQDEVLIRVYDPAGKLSRSSQFFANSDGEHIFEWDCSTLAPGLYFYEISLNGHRANSGRIAVAQ